MASYKLVYNRNDRLRKDGRAPVLIEVYFDRTHRKYIKTGILLFPNQWDSRANHVKVTDSLMAGYRDKIDNLVKKAKRYESEKLLKDQDFKPEDVAVIYRPPKVSESFSDFFTSQLSNRFDMKADSKRPFANTLKLLNKYKGGDVVFSDLTFEFIDGFNQFMYEEGLQVNTVHGHHKRLKRLIRQAINRDHITSDPYTKMGKIKTSPSDRPHLNMDELVAVENCEVEDRKVQKVKDMFLFSCYCGLRFSDVQALCMDHLELTTEGYSIALHKLIKVPQPVFIPLYALFDGKGETVLKKYIEMDPDRSKSSPLFPSLSNQKCNEYLKLLSGYSKIKKQLSFHVSRYTCASHLAYYIPDPFFIMQVMGWRKLETAMIYIKGSHEIIKRKAEQVNWNKYNGHDE